MKKYRKLNQQNKQSREKNSLGSMALKIVQQSTLRRIADYLLWDLFELDELIKKVISLISAFFDDE